MSAQRIADRLLEMDEFDHVDPKEALAHSFSPLITKFGLLWALDRAGFRTGSLRADVYHGQMEYIAVQCYYHGSVLGAKRAFGRLMRDHPQLKKFVRNFSFDNDEAFFSGTAKINRHIRFDIPRWAVEDDQRGITPSGFSSVIRDAF